MRARLPTVLQHTFEMLQIAREGEPATDLYILAHGAVRVIKVCVLIVIFMHRVYVSIRTCVCGRKCVHACAGTCTHVLFSPFFRHCCFLKVCQQTAQVYSYDLHPYTGGGCTLQDGAARVHAHTRRHFRAHLSISSENSGARAAGALWRQIKSFGYCQISMRSS